MSRIRVFRALRTRLRHLTFSCMLRGAMESCKCCGVIKVVSGIYKSQFVLKGARGWLMFADLLLSISGSQPVVTLAFKRHLALS